MKKWFLYIFCYMNVCASLGAQQLHIPLLISGKVYNSKSEIISQDALRFRVFLDGNPAVYLDQDDASCGYLAPRWFAELGNLQTTWEFGDRLIIHIEDIESRENIKVTWTIDSTGQVPEIQTQPLYQKDLITQFTLSDKGVFHNNPLKFTFRSLFSELPRIELKIFSAAGRLVYKTNRPEVVDFDLYQFSWDGKSARGEHLVSGLYYYLLNVDGSHLHSGIITLKNE